MKRNEFLKTLGVGTIIFPVISSCMKDNSILSEPGTDNGSNGDCEITNAETAGPFPTKDPSSLERLDIRGDRTGILLDVEMIILNKGNDCLPLEGAIVDIWHCDKDGYYSEYGGTNMQRNDYSAVHFLRGRQVSDENGVVKYKTIFPGWYQGRATHIHVHIYNSSGKSLLVTQVAFPEGDNSAVALVNASSENGYTKGLNGYTYNSRDNVFSDGVANELAVLSGSINEGYGLTHSIVVNG